MRKAAASDAWSRAKQNHVDMLLNELLRHRCTTTRVGKSLTKHVTMTLEEKALGAQGLKHVVEGYKQGLKGQVSVAVLQCAGAGVSRLQHFSASRA